MKNEFELIGRVSQEPKLIITKLNQLPYTNLSVAVSKNVKQQDGSYKEYTDFISVSCWRSLAEYISKYVGVGDLVRLNGHIKVRKDFDVEKNTNINTIDLIGDKIKVIVRKPKEDKKEKIKEQPKENIKVSELKFDEFDLPF